VVLVIAEADASELPRTARTAIGRGPARGAVRRGCDGLKEISSTHWIEHINRRLTEAYRHARPPAAH
jgi:hypothetical protein